MASGTNNIHLQPGDVVSLRVWDHETTRGVDVKVNGLTWITLFGLNDAGLRAVAEQIVDHLARVEQPAEGEPDLLASLERMLAAHDADVDRGSLIAAGNGQAADQARAAIAKAKGGA